METPTNTQETSDKTTDVVVDMMSTFDSVPKQLSNPWVEDRTYESYNTHRRLIINYGWLSTASDTVLSTDIFSSFINASDLMSGKVDNFMYYTGDLKITVVIQGMSYAYGQANLCFLPHVAPRGVTNTNTVQLPGKVRSFTLPHINLDPSKTCSCEITLPCPTPSNVWSSDQRSYIMRFIVINPLDSGTATAVQPVSISIYAGFEKPKFGPIMYASSVQEKEQTSMKPSAIADTISSVSGQLSQVPIIGHAASVVSNIAGTAAKVLSFFGFSKPPLTNLTMPFLNRVHNNLAHVNGVTSAYTLASDESNSIGVSPDFYPLGNMTDMSMSDICKIKGLVSQIEWTIARGHGYYLGGIDVTPNITYFTVNTFYEMTPLQHMTIPFRWWSGTITATIEIVASIFHRGTIVVAHSPDGAIPSGLNEALVSLETKTITLSGNTGVEFVVPWRQIDPAIRVGSLGSPPATNGKLLFWVLNPLTSNGSTEPIYVNVFYHSDSMYCFAPTVENMVGATVSTITYACDIVPPLKDNKNVVPVPDFYLRFAGENLFVSTKKLASKMSPIGYDNAMHQGINLDNYPYMPTSQSIFSMASVTLTWSYYSIMAIGYAGVRGSVNLSVASFASVPLGFLFTTRYGEEPYIRSKLPDIDSGSFGWSYDRITNEASTTLPYYNAAYYKPIFPIGLQNYNAHVANFSPFFNGADLSPDGYYFQGMGEDGLFVGYIGCPALDLS